MKRGSIRMTILLILGAAMNLAVAWVCVFAQGVVESDWNPYFSPYDDYPAVIHVTRRFGYEQVVGVARSGTLLDRRGDEVRLYHGRVWFSEEPLQQPMLNAYAIAGGWPLLSHSCWLTVGWNIQPNGDEIEYFLNVHWGILPKKYREDSPGASRIRDGAFPILPLRPIWTGFIINTVFYAVILWLLLFAPFTARRVIRRRRGLCEHCAYPIGVSPVCTECGAAVGVSHGGRVQTLDTSSTEVESRPA